MDAKQALTVSGFLGYSTSCINMEWTLEYAVPLGTHSYTDCKCSVFVGGQQFPEFNAGQGVHQGDVFPIKLYQVSKLY